MLLKVQPASAETKLVPAQQAVWRKQRTWILPSMHILVPNALLVPSGSNTATFAARLAHQKLVFLRERRVDGISVLTPAALAEMVAACAASLQQGVDSASIFALTNSTLPDALLLGDQVMQDTLVQCSMRLATGTASVVSSPRPNVMTTHLQTNLCVPAHLESDQHSEMESQRICLPQASMTHLLCQTAPSLSVAKSVATVESKSIRDSTPGWRLHPATAESAFSIATLGEPLAVSVVQWAACIIPVSTGLRLHVAAQQPIGHCIRSNVANCMLLVSIVFSKLNQFMTFAIPMCLRTYIKFVLH